MRPPQSEQRLYSIIMIHWWSVGYGCIEMNWSDKVSLNWYMWCVVGLGMWISCDDKVWLHNIHDGNAVFVHTQNGHLGFMVCSVMEQHHRRSLWYCTFFTRNVLKIIECTHFYLVTRVWEHFKSKQNYKSFFIMHAKIMQSSMIMNID